MFNITIEDTSKADIDMSFIDEYIVKINKKKEDIITINENDKKYIDQMMMTQDLDIITHDTKISDEKSFDSNEHIFQSNENIFEICEEPVLFPSILKAKSKYTTKQHKSIGKPDKKSSVKKEIKLPESKTISITESQLDETDILLSKLLDEIDPQNTSTESKVIKKDQSIDKSKKHNILKYTDQKETKIKVNTKIDLPSSQLTSKYFQEEASSNYINNITDKMLIFMAGSSGKTFTIYLMLKHSINNNMNIFIVATSSNDLLYQMAEKIYKFTIKDEIFVNFMINDSTNNGKLYLTILNKDSVKYLTNKSINHIIFTTYDKGLNMLNLLNSYNIIVNSLFCDESHRIIENIYNYYNDNLLNIDNDIINNYSSLVNNTFDHLINKKVFITATPLSINKDNINEIFDKDKYNILDITMKNEIINNLLNYSMNNIGLYGKVIYDYPINQALKDESIVDWESIIITRKEYKSNIKKLLSSIDTLQKNIDDFMNQFNYKYKYHILLTAERILNQLITNNSSHCIVYTNNIKSIDCINSAFKFWINLMNSGIIKIDKEIKHNLYNITNSNNYSMIREYKTSIKPIKDSYTIGLYEFNIIITNDGLNEGIELSMCNTVAFIMPKKLEHEIIQNFGRCLRKIPKKDKAYVIFSEGIMIDIDKICIGPYDNIIKTSKRMRSNATNMCYI